MELTGVPLEQPQRRLGRLLAGGLLVSELPPAPQLEADKLPQQPGLGQAHQQQDGHPEWREDSAIGEASCDLTGKTGAVEPRRLWIEEDLQWLLSVWGDGGST